MLSDRVYDEYEIDEAIEKSSQQVSESLKNQEKTLVLKSLVFFIMHVFIGWSFLIFSG